MKTATVVLFLGCSALATRFAVQSHLPYTETPLACPQSLHETLERLGSLLPHVELPHLAMPVVTGVAKLQLQHIPLLPKSSALGLIAISAAKHNVPAAFVQSIVAAESNFDCEAVSPKGAIGLMQLMPETAQQFGADPNIPAQNIEAGTRYLRWLMNRYRNSRKSVIAAYNAGPGMVDRYHGIPPFRETRSYVSRVMGFLRELEGPRKHGGTRG